MRRLALFCLPLFILAGCGRLTSGQMSQAEAEARSYAGANYPDHEIVNVDCKGLDSDGDGYVRCNLSVRNGTNTQTPNIECAYGKMMSWAEGCQQPKAGVSRD